MLKGKFLHGKRNRWIDHLIHILINDVVTYFSAKHHRQDFGFEGLDLEMRHHVTVNAAAQTFPLTNITELEVDDDPASSLYNPSQTPAFHIMLILRLMSANAPPGPLSSTVSTWPPSSFTSMTMTVTC